MLLKIIHQYIADIDLAIEYKDEIWFKILSKIDKSRDGKFFAWIVTIAKNYCISQYRKKRHILEIDFDIEEEVDDKWEKILLIMNEIELLPEHYRIIFEYRMEEFTFKDISGILGVPFGTVLQRYRDGILRIRRSLVEKELIFVKIDNKLRKIY